MVASQPRVPRIYPLPKKVLSHSTFRALLERRRQALDNLIVLLKTETSNKENGKIEESALVANGAGEDLPQGDGETVEEGRLLLEGVEAHLDTGRGVEEERAAGREVGVKDGPDEEVIVQESGKQAEESLMDLDRAEGTINGNIADAQAEAVPDGGAQAPVSPDPPPDSLPASGGPALLGNDEKPEDSGQGGPAEANIGGGTGGQEELQKGIQKADLEEQLNKLESKKHELVQQLKQVLVREDSRKIVRAPLPQSPIPSPSSSTVSLSYYLPHSSPLPSGTSGLPSPATTPTPSNIPPRKEEDGLEEGELPDGGSPAQKPPPEPERASVPGSVGDWERGRLMHSTSWDQRNERYFPGGGTAARIAERKLWESIRSILPPASEFTEELFIRTKFYRAGSLSREGYRTRFGPRRCTGFGSGCFRGGRG